MLDAIIERTDGQRVIQETGHKREARGQRREAIGARSEDRGQRIELRGWMNEERCDERRKKGRRRGKLLGIGQLA